MQSNLIDFLRKELNITDPAIALAQRRQAETSGTLPMALWLYGLVTLEQLNQIFDWLENVPK
jgi:Protein of unknown function (DUF2949)